MTEKSSMFIILLVVAIGIVGIMLVANVTFSGQATIDSAAQAQIAILKGRVADLEARMLILEEHTPNS